MHTMMKVIEGSNGEASINKESTSEGGVVWEKN